MTKDLVILKGVDKLESAISKVEVYSEEWHEVIKHAKIPKHEIEMRSKTSERPEIKSTYEKLQEVIGIA